MELNPCQKNGKRIFTRKKHAPLEVELKLKDEYDGNQSSMSSIEDISNLRNLEVVCHDLLSKVEVTWRLKSHVIWIVKGDRNSKFLHRFQTIGKI